MKLSKKDRQKFERLRVDWSEIHKAIRTSATTDRQLKSALMQKGWGIPDIRQLLSAVKRSEEIGVKKGKAINRKGKRNLNQRINPIAKINFIGRVRALQGGAPGLKSQK